jgi:TetR/AcrR family transcriptional repressor of nem operon
MNPTLQAEPLPGPHATAERILDAAERLVQQRGFNGFSYADIAAELGITKASLHYHYPSKADLGQALIARYSERFLDALQAIDADAEDAPAKLAAYAGLYATVLKGERMCLCGMLAAEYTTLPEQMRGAVIAFFELNETWLAGVLDAGRSDGTLEFDGPTRDVAQTTISTLEGALLVSRPYNDPARFERAARQVLASVTATGR